MPELRQPTDRAEAWSEWRRRIAGERVPVSDEPRCGFYRSKRRGNFVGVQIDLLQEIGEDGELIAEERMAAFIGDDIFFDRHLGEIWLRCAGSPITEAEFARLSKMPHVTDLSREFVV